MPRPTLLVASLLLLATGLGLIGLAQSVDTLALPAAPVDTEANLATARDFYAAVGRVLATGDSTALDALVDPDLVEHPARPGDPGRAGLVRAVLARRAVFPGQRLVVDDFVAVGDEVAVRVHAEGATAGSFLGMAVPAGAAAWGPVEVLRIDAGRVAERWGGAGEPTLLNPLWKVPLPTGLPDAPLVVAVRRVTWEPGAMLIVESNPAAWFLFVEEGTLSVAASLERPVLIGSDREATTVPRELFAVPAGTRFAARNGGTGRAVAVAVAMWEHTSISPMILPGDSGLAWNPEAAALGLGRDAAGDTVLAPGVVARVLTTATNVWMPAGATLAAGRVVLAPGAALSLDADGSLLIAVEAGRIEFGIEGHIAWTIGAAGGTKEVPGRAKMAAGDGALTTIGAVSFWQTSADPAIVLVLAVLSAPDSA